MPREGGREGVEGEKGCKTGEGGTGGQAKRQQRWHELAAREATAGRLSNCPSFCHGCAPPPQCFLFLIQFFHIEILAKFDKRISRICTMKKKIPKFSPKIPKISPEKKSLLLLFLHRFATPVFK
jgi:hypothetical protein